jgi:hypothetical protein
VRFLAALCSLYTIASPPAALSVAGVLPSFECRASGFSVGVVAPHVGSNSCAATKSAGDSCKETSAYFDLALPPQLVSLESQLSPPVEAFEIFVSALVAKYRIPTGLSPPRAFES